ncbi:MAG: alpha/beta fold hydrolase [Candidatus Thorarchaeota archaeon]
MSEIVQSKETTVKINGIEITYDTFGDPQAEPILLIMGLGGQMTMWDEAFCKEIAANGYWVIRFDNRDVGLSTKFDDAGIPDLMDMMMKVQQNESVESPYTLLDMANDAIGLLDALHIETANIVGTSMGGMIAQTIAIHYPERVRSLTSIMSTTSNPELPQPGPEAISILVTPPPSDRAEYVEDSVKTWRFLNGKLPFDEEYVRKRSAMAFDRSYYPMGTGRQLAAILASGSRKDELKNVLVPTLVIHGDADPLVPIEGGKETAEVIPGAKLIIIEGMGHSIPAAAAPRIIEAIINHAV